MRVEGTTPGTTIVAANNNTHDLEIVVTFTLHTKLAFIQSLINPGYSGTTFTVDLATLRPRRTP